MKKKIKTKNKLIIINCNTSYSNKAMKETRLSRGEKPMNEIVWEDPPEQGPCSACGDGDTAQQFHKHGVSCALEY